jgi:hypothetical protein
MLEWIFLHIASALLLVAFSLSKIRAPLLLDAHISFEQLTQVFESIPYLPCCPERRYSLYSCANHFKHKKIDEVSCLN